MVQLNSGAVTQSIPPLLVREHPAMPVPLNAGEHPPSDYDLLDVRVVGIGPLGATMANVVSRTLSGVTCHEVVPDSSGLASGGIGDLISSLTTADLVFIATEFDDEQCGIISQTVGTATVAAGVPTVAVTSCRTDPIRSCDGRRWCDTAFSVPAGSLPEPEDAATMNSPPLWEYSILQVVSVMTNLISHRTWIGIDFADVKTIIHDGDVGRFGVGGGGGTTRAADAAERALARLEGQGVYLASAKGILAVVHGSSLLTKEDYDSGSKVIFDHASEDADLLIGLIVDEALGANIKVSVLAVLEG